MTSALRKRSDGFLVKAVYLSLVATLFFALGFACNEGGEGDRCNPAAAANGEDECGSGLSCQTPSTCVESYCCPKDPSGSKNPYCNGMACPQSDAGVD
jgi:hypothetical protein